MTEDRDVVRGSLDTVSDWRLARPADVPGQSMGQADYVLIAEILEVERFEQQASEHVQRLADDLDHLVSSRGMLVLRPRPLTNMAGAHCASSDAGPVCVRSSDVGRPNLSKTAPSNVTISITAPSAIVSTSSARGR
jgi:hypothetical protein